MREVHEHGSVGAVTPPVLREKAREVLTAVRRRSRSPSELRQRFDEIVQYMRTECEALQCATREREREMDELLAANVSIERLRLLSVLVAAFCRRSQEVLGAGAGPSSAYFSYGGGPQAEAPRSRTLPQEKAYVDTLATLLERATAVIERRLETFPRRGAGGSGVLPPPSPSALGSPLPSFGGLPPLPPPTRPPVSALVSNICRATTSYARGEVLDYRHLLLRRTKDRLHGLLGAVGWDPDAVVQALLDLSSFSTEQDLPSAESQTSSPQRSPARAGQPEVAVAVCRSVLRDPLSQGVILYPCRGVRCEHLEFFDAKNFLTCYAPPKQRLWDSPAARPVAGAGGPCPFCKDFLPLEDLRIDERVVNAMTAHCSGRAEGDKTAPSGVSAASPDEPPAPALTVDCVVEWDMRSTPLRCRVLQSERNGRARASSEPDVAVDARSSLALPPSTAVPRPAREPADPTEGDTKRRRVEVGGHVLVSLKEFSTTPTVSYMLSKNGQNLAPSAEQRPPHSIPPPQRDRSTVTQPPSADEDDMYDME